MLTWFVNGRTVKFWTLACIFHPFHLVVKQSCVEGLMLTLWAVYWVTDTWNIDSYWCIINLFSPLPKIAKCGEVCASQLVPLRQKPREDYDDESTQLVPGYTWKSYRECKIQRKFRFNIGFLYWFWWNNKTEKLQL